CRAAEERGFPVVFGNALDPRTGARARLELAALALGVTPNDEVNSLFVREAREVFGVPATAVAVGRGKGVGDALLERIGTRILFDRAKDVERWAVRLRHGAVRYETWRFERAPAAPPPDPGGAADAWLVLAVTRGAGTEPMHAGWTPREGDRAHVLVHEPEADLAEQALRARGWAREPESDAA